MAEKKKVNVTLIVAIAAAVIVAVVLLIVGLVGKVPDKLIGTWYETTGVGPVFDFDVHGVVEYQLPLSSGKGTYEYDSATGQGMIDIPEDGYEPSAFTCDGVTMEFVSMQLTHAFVERVDYKEVFGDMINQLQETDAQSGSSE